MIRNDVIMTVFLGSYTNLHKILSRERFDVIMMSKTMENNWKIRTSTEPNKTYIVGKVLMGAFLLNSSHCVKSYGHLYQIYHNHSPDVVMSRDSGFKFQNFLFFA